MRVHSDTLTHADLLDAARISRTALSVTAHGSRKRDHAFNVTLRGESKRRPNTGSYGAADEYAATWDQWGVFIAHLFELDHSAEMTYYKDAGDFHYRTASRFDGGWPDDAHGDHRFKYDGIPYEQKCVKCSAVIRWQ